MKLTKLYAIFTTLRKSSSQLKEALTEFQDIRPLCPSQEHPNVFPRVTITVNPLAVAYCRTNHNVAVIQEIRAVACKVTLSAIERQLFGTLEQVKKGHGFETRSQPM